MFKDKKTKNLIIALLLVLAVFAIFMVYSNTQNVKTISYAEFKDIVFQGKVQAAVGQGNYVRIKFVDGTEEKQITTEEFKKGGADRQVVIGSVTDFYNFCEEYKSGNLIVNGDLVVPVVDFDYDWTPQSESLLSTILPYLSFILIAIFAFMVLRSISNVNSKNVGFGKNKSRNVQISNVKFSDVAGAEEEKFELKEVVDFLSNNQKFLDLGARIPKGVLLVGPPGTGKTMLAKAVAGESHVPFFQISGSDFVEMFVGVGASRVRDLFNQAKRSAPAIVFIDEIDAVGRQRGAGFGGGNDEREQTLNQLLVEMDGFESTTGVIVMAATNRPDVLDPALLRPGRFDRQIFVNMPDVGEREAILLVHAKNKKFTEDVNFKNIARITSGFSGADLENLLNEAAILAGRDNRPRITMTDMNEAATKVMMGPQKKSKVMTEKDKEITAYHESGHAILHKLLPHCDVVHEVSIIPRGMAGGYTMSRPDTDDNYSTLNKLNDTICSMMGGRVAEELIFKDYTTGASNDIEQATKLAKKMVTQFGMSSKLGFINLGSTSEVFIGRDYQEKNSYSEATAKLIDEEVENILNDNYIKAKKLLSENKDKLDNIAKLLLKQSTIFQGEVDEIMEGKTIASIIKKMEKRENNEKEMLKKEKEENQKIEDQKLRELKEKAFNALKKEGIIPQDQQFDEYVDKQKKNMENAKQTESSSVESSTKSEETNDAKLAEDKKSEEKVIDKELGKTGEVPKIEKKVKAKKSSTNKKSKNIK